MNILVIGGCGYVGTMLTMDLIEKKHNVTVLDAQWFGNYLPKKNPQLKILKGDIRNINNISFDKIDTVIHLANIANDPAVELNPNLSWEVNVLAMKNILEKSILSNVTQFIFASSGSVYGISEKPKVTEDTPLLPITVYNKTKMIAERVAISYENKIKIHCIRPSSVCGWSPRMRLDITVNAMTFKALKDKELVVYGGKQMRPNIHVKDIVRVFNHFIKNSDLPNGFYNAGFENLSIIEIAKLIQKKIKSNLILKKSNDLRSYRQDSQKLIDTGFEKKYSVTDAIDELIKKYENGELKDKDSCYTVKQMKQMKII